jgi:hypothetical protein
MHTYRTREELRLKLVQAFAVLPEVYHIHFFGREAEGNSDGYSDIDMVVCTNDLAKTETEYRQVLGAISPIRATFCLESTSQSHSEMVMLRDYSPYQKIDLTLGDDSQLGWPDPSGPLLIAHKDLACAKPSSTKLDSLDIRHDIRYQLTDILFSLARFTKCLFRHDLDMYRRWISITTATLVLLYQKHYGWEPETKRTGVGSSEIRHLYQRLTLHEREQLDLIRPPSAKLDLARSYQASIGLFVELALQKAASLRVPLDVDLIQYMREFLDFEIERYTCLGV